jgi:adenine-specific DNA-methyltransferase
MDYLEKMDITGITENVASLSLNYMERTDKKYLKKNGQFFTVDQVLLTALLDDYAWKSDVTSILEPSCGSGTIIAECLKEAGKECRIKGMDIEECLVESSREIFKNYKNVEITKGNFLEAAFDEKFDLIVGNPPYFEMSLDNKQREEFEEIICGRANIYGLFIYKSIQLLKEGGELRFIIPRTILSGKYFCKLREYIHKNCDVIDIVKFNKSNMFKKALQSVIILKLRKTTKPKEDFVIKLDGRVYFAKNKEKLSLEGRTSIKDLGCRVKTGSIEWNKNKELLVSEQVDDTLPLVMASNLKDGHVVYFNGGSSEKKQYMKKTKENEKQIQCGPCIFVNRIVGLDPVRLNVVLERSVEKQFFVENHVNVINGELSKLEIIERSLREEFTREFLNELLGSTQISQYELECIVPIKGELR